jgi:hypothetical protein
MTRDLPSRERPTEATAPARHGVGRHLDSTLRPLGLLADAPVGQGEIDALSRIERFDLTLIHRRLTRSGAMTPGWADTAIFEFRRYLGIRAVFAEPVTMLSGDVDEVWHTCLLFTRLYADLCQQAFGRFLHHDPETEGDTDRMAAWSAFASSYRCLCGEPGFVWQVWRPGDAPEQASPPY